MLLDQTSSGSEKLKKNLESPLNVKTETAIFNDFNLNIVFIFNENNQYTLYNSRYCKTPELYDTSMATYMIIRAGLFAKSIFKRQGLFSRGLIWEWGLKSIIY